MTARAKLNGKNLKFEDNKWQEDYLAYVNGKDAYYVVLQKNKCVIHLSTSKIAECLRSNEHLFTKMLEVYFENELAKNDQEAIKIMQLRKKMLGGTK